MLDMHPMVADIWNFLPMQLIFPSIIIWLGNFVLFIPNIILRPIWLVWNVIMGIPTLIIMIITAPFAA